MRSQAKRKLAPGGMPHHHDLLGIKASHLSVLFEIPIRCTQVLESSRPASAIISDSPVFEMRACQAFRRQRRTEMTVVLEVVFRAPETAMNVDDQRPMRLHAG